MYAPDRCLCSLQVSPERYSDAHSGCAFGGAVHPSGRWWWEIAKPYID